MTTTQKKRKAPKKCNGLDGKNWLKNSISVWSDLTRTAEEKALKHPAMFPVALARRLIDTFTPEGPSVVLDPFAGSGTTLVAAEKSGKGAIGFELSPEFDAVARKRIATNTTILFNESCSHLGDRVQPESCDLCVTSPPYWNILNQKRSADLKAGRHYGNLPGDLGTEESYVLFLDSLELVFRDVFHALKPGAYCCVVVMDIRKKDQFYQFHADVAARLKHAGFKFDDLIIWDRRADYNNFKPLGYPSVFRVNKAHEFIVIAQKPKGWTMLEIMTCIFLAVATMFLFWVGIALEKRLEAQRDLFHAEARKANTDARMNELYLLRKRPAPPIKAGLPESMCPSFPRI